MVCLPIAVGAVPRQRTRARYCFRQMELDRFKLRCATSSSQFRNQQASLAHGTTRHDLWIPSWSNCNALKPEILADLPHQIETGYKVKLGEIEGWMRLLDSR